MSAKLRRSDYTTEVIGCVDIYYLVLPLVLVEFRLGVLHGFLFQFLRQLFDREPREPAQHELLQRVVYEFVLVLVCMAIKYNVTLLR